VPEPSAAGGVGDARLLGDALPLLYDESARAAPCAAVSFFNTQGSADELEEAILAAVADSNGAPAPGSIALLARSLEPYAAALAPVARRHGLPLSTSAALPLSRESASLAATRLLRCLLLDMPTGALFDLIRSGRLRPIDGRDPAGDVDAWERLTREWQVAGGRENLAGRLPGWIEAAAPILPDQPDDEAVERAARRKRALLALARRLRDLVLALEREARPLRAARDQRLFAAAARRVLAARLVGFEAADRGAEAAADPAVEAILAALDDLDAVAAAGVRFESPAATLETLEQGIGALTLPVGALGPDGARAGEDAGGVRVLDLMQARGMAFDTVALVGLNAGLLPRPARVDPFLPDADRALLRSRLRRPIAIKEEALAEEHLLLALALGSARRRLLVSWQRADDDGRARAPSLALREIGRVARGAPEIDPLVEESRRISADPLARARAAIAAHAMLPAAATAPALAILAGAPERFRSTGLPAVLAAIGGGEMLPALDAGLAYLQAIDSRDITTFDALPGGAGPEGPWSPSRLETFGACPQQYFFRHRLRIEEWSDPDSPDAIDRRELGTLAHAVLADDYRATPPGAAGTVTAIAARLATLWSQHAGPLAARLDALYPGLFAIESDAWVGALARFVARDRAALLERDGRLEVERPIAATLALPGFGDLSLRGRVDRSLRDAAGILVGDYKTGGTPENLVNRTRLLKGERLQMALYALLAESEAGPGKASVEVLGVGPKFDDDPEGATARLEAEDFEAIRDCLLESLAVLARLAAANRFPLSPRAGLCEYCPYARACRRAHPATLERLLAHPALAEFHRMRRKNSRKPRLAVVTSDGPEEEA
ncbi:MAG TPA: PD-(D/E)XK nuclease family protein, partial [Dongiaceae bacterium]|nr:PD-(D/E)XK nuclease family protein [Dongiaceae bacterium]